MDDKYLDTLNFVVNFLHEEGFYKAHQLLLQEVQTRFSSRDHAETELLARPSTSAASAPPSSDGCGLRALDADSMPRSKSAQPTWDGFPTPSSTLTKAASTAGAVESTTMALPVAEPAQVKPVAPVQQSTSSSGVKQPDPHTAVADRPAQKRISRGTSGKTKIMWDADVDEYDNMDDPGYMRRDVVGQQRFVDTELDLSSEDGSDRNYFMHQPGDLNYDDVESEVSASDLEGATPGSSSYSGQFAAGGPGPGGPRDESWDLGPMDIKFAEPVSTPSKSPEKLEPEERGGRPVLSRVESLSSSFKDFELERGTLDADGEQVISGKVSDAGYATDPEVIDFPVANAAQAFVNHEDVELFRNRDSRTSSLDVAAGSVALSEHNSEVSERERAKRKAAKPTSLLKALATARTGDVRENGGGAAGGFSFPVTPPSDEPDQRIFTSWPSVRSSCASEPAANSDDDNAAEYADDEYSKSKVSSRSTSLANPDLLLSKVASDASGGSSAVPTSIDADNAGQLLLDTAAAAPPEPAHPEWEFKPVQCTRASQEAREPSLEFSAPNTEDEGGADTPTAAATLDARMSAQAHLGAAGDEDAAAAPSSSSAAAEAQASQEGASAADQRDVSSPQQAEPSHAAPPAAAGTGPAPGGSSAGSEQTTPPTRTVRGPERRGSGIVDSHQISLTIEDLREHSTGGDHSQDTLPAPLSDVDGATSGHHDQGAAQGSLLSRPVLVGGTGTGTDDEGQEQSVDSYGLGLERRASGPLEDEDEDELPHDVDTEAEAWAEQHQEHEPHALDAKAGASGPLESPVMPRYHLDEHGNVLYEYDSEYLEKKYEVFDLRIIHRRHRTGFEETKDFPIRLNDLIAGRYQVMDFLGSAAFSRAVQALDIKTGQLVCLKIIKNNKDYFDQSLDEIKLLKYVNGMDPNDEYAIVRLYDYFYYKEHLFLVCELLRANLYEFQKYNKESGDDMYFTNARIQRIARQSLRSLAFLHSLGLIHSDLKPENILIKSYSRCEVKVIDLGSSCFITDQLSSYVQSRSYRAPEVILGLPYDHKVDVWSLGCILAELSSGYVLFQNDSLSTLLARLEGILGPIPEWMLHKGRYSHRFYTRSGMLYERNATTQRYELLVSKRSSLKHRMPDADDGLLEFVAYLLTVDPRKRPTAAEALNHPWLQHPYLSLDASPA